MFTKKSAPPDSPLTVVTYELLEPAEMLVERPDGLQVLMGYGIGEKLQVIEPQIQNLVYTTEQKDYVLLADGTKIIRWPRIIRNKRCFL